MKDFTQQYEAVIMINNRPVTEYNHTDGQIYIEGRRGSEYTLNFRNNSNERILVVPAIDGLSVIDGKPAGLDSDGYVLNAHTSVAIPGWRLNANEVAKFEFGDTRSSYTAKTGQGTTNVGVIGFMVFREAFIPQPVARAWSATPPDFWTLGANSQNDVLRGASINAQSLHSNEVGTGFGDVSKFETINVNFKKRDSKNPDSLMVLYYDSIRGLEKRGIIMKNNNPDPFPSYTSTNSCSPPPGWRR